MDAKNHKLNSSKLLDVPLNVSNPMLCFKCDYKRKIRMNEVTIMDLPRVIMVEILSRLPIKSIFCCKTVCKLWYHLLTSDPLFLKLYHTSNFPCILFSDDDSITSLLELKADYDYKSQPLNRPIVLSPKFHLPPLKLKPQVLIGSCNGFVCLLDGSTYDEKHSVYINNPLLGEYFKLKLPEWEKSLRNVAYGFCYSEASGQYKVLRLVFRKLLDHPIISELEVYTLGVDENWRNVGQVPCPVWYHFGKVYVNGALHWLADEKNESIYSFDIGTEKLKSLPPPPCLKTQWWLTLAELGNCLFLTDSNIDRQCVDIWWMKQYGIAESWTKDCILMDSLPPGMGRYSLEMILIWKDGEILMQNGRRLASYNPKEKKSKEVNVYNSGTVATRYIPSFHSLKTVMGNNFQVSNVYSKTQII
ncbi:F-box protein At3g07870-like [Lycium ferocissimum]|uniref:F-box protein At3g07870-like n=1 Tax=Lycium ferocissimum TaxID=112874 RepID=UPI002814DC81|nr:F-box protein At3g07870-like [Lycium ferocissimum]